MQHARQGFNQMERKAFGPSDLFVRSNGQKGWLVFAFIIIIFYLQREKKKKRRE